MGDIARRLLRLRWVATALEYLPKGQLLPEDVWRRRHLALSYLLRLHVVGLFIFALVQGRGLTHSLLEASIVGAFAVAASLNSCPRKFTSAACALGLITSSAVLVHLGEGTIELHFHFFVMVGILTLYQDWVPFLLAIGYVVLHHGVLGTMAPAEVYNHPAAIAHPFRWAVIHGAFVLAASVASIVAWRLNEEQALRDSLTRLANRTLFNDRLNHAVARTARSRSRLAVLFLDVDNFKNVNDTLGHGAGDHLLTTIAERVKACVRGGDTVARLGGDEFAVLLEDTTGDQDATIVAERILQAFEAPFCIRNKEVFVGASLGVAMSFTGATVEELLRNADVAMYNAKRDGKGAYRFFQDSMHTEVIERVELERDLALGIDRSEFIVHYQPLVNLDTGKMKGVEALVRWQHPERGLLMPGEFIEAAEQSGAIVPLGWWVLDEACAQARQWRDRTLDETFTVSVNLSPRQFNEPDCVERVRTTLVKNQLPPQALVLEVTEGVMLFDSAATVQRLTALKSLGVQLAIDDFGTGYSSLSYLRKLPFDIIKIDKLFVDGIAAGPTESAFAQAIMRLAGTLELETVAEGVEGADQVDVLREMKCDVGQGYLFAKPLTVDGIDALLGTATLRAGATPRP